MAVQHERAGRSVLGPTPSPGSGRSGVPERRTLQTQDPRVLAHSERQLRETQELTHVGSWEWLVDAGELTWSQEHYNIFGVTVEGYEPSQTNAFACVHPDDVARLKGIVSQAIKDHLSFSCEFRVIRPDGSQRSVVSRGTWAKTGAGHDRRMFGTTQDVTLMNQARSQLVTANRRTRALAGTIQAQESERRHLARELHDDLGQALTAITIRLHRLKRRPQSEQAGADLEKCIEIAARSLEQVRSLSLNLRPPHLDDLGLPAAIGWLMDQQCEAADLRQTFIVRELPGDIPDEIRVACFRVAQEALTNVIRHAAATDVRAELGATEHWLCFSMTDDGRGFDYVLARTASERGASMGIIGMEERTALLGGYLEVRSAPQEGTTITAYFPLRRACSQNPVKP